MFCGGIVENKTPESLEKALRMAKDFVDFHPYQALLITINSWNEWTETSNRESCAIYGYSYLEAFRNVFCKKKDWF